MNHELQKQLSERFAKRFETFNLRVLKELGDTIKSFNGLIPKDAYRLAQQLKYNTTIKNLMQELSEITEKSIKDIEKVLERVVKDNIELASVYYEAQGLNVPIYEKTKDLQNLVKSMAELSGNEFINIARTTGFRLLDSDRKPIFLDLRDTYYKVIDEAVYAVTTGKDSYNQQMRSILNQLADSGVRRMEYESGYTRRIDSAVRMNIMDTIKQVSNESQKMFGKEFGSNGVEVTVHEHPAPDHEQAQGRQFSHEEFEKFQNHEECKDVQGRVYSPKEAFRERRAISEYNCYHSTNQIILGVSKPLFNDDELQEIINKNHTGIVIDGKKYTIYEATQLQRKIETEIRYAKEKLLLAEHAGNEELVLTSQQKVSQLKYKHKQISGQAKLSVDVDRTYIPKYKSKTKGGDSNE